MTPGSTALPPAAAPAGCAGRRLHSAEEIDTLRDATIQALEPGDPMATKSCLLIVDVQNGFINEHTRHVPAAVEESQSNYDFVYATRFFNMTDSLYRRLIGWHRMERDTPEFELAFKPRDGTRVIDKPIYTCVDKAFVAELQGLGIRSVDVCGIETDICVTKCAVDLFESGIEPRVLAALCGSTAGSQAHQAALGTLARFIGKGQVVG